MSDIDVILEQFDVDEDMNVLLAEFDAIDTKSAEAAARLVEPLDWADKLVYHPAVNKRNDCRFMLTRFTL